MQLDDVVVRLRTYVMETFRIPPDDATFDDDVHLFDYGYVDSFGAAQITAYSDQEFGVKIGPEDLIVRPLNTIREISTLIHERLEERRS